MWCHSKVLNDITTWLHVTVHLAKHICDAAVHFLSTVYAVLSFLPTYTVLVSSFFHIWHIIIFIALLTMFIVVVIILIIHIMVIINLLYIEIIRILYCYVCISLSWKTTAVGVRQESVTWVQRSKKALQLLCSGVCLWPARPLTPWPWLIEGLDWVLRR